MYSTSSLPIETEMQPLLSANLGLRWRDGAGIRFL